MVGRIGAFIFGGVFAAAGIIIFYFLIWPTLSLAIQAKSWQPVEATLQSLNLETFQGDNGTTYKVKGNYQYSWAGREFSGDRFFLTDMSDNIGSFHQDLYQQLDQARKNNQPVTIWVNPEMPSESIVNREIRWGLLSFVTGFSAIFTGVGLAIIFFAFKSSGSVKHFPVSDPTGSLTQKPWLENKKWQTNTIASTIKAQVIVAWFFALTCVAVSVPIINILPAELGKGNHIALVALLFPLVGVFLTWKAVVDTLRWIRFGKTPLLMDPFPGSIGGDIGGHFEINLPFDPSLTCRITVNCVHSYMSGSGKNRSRREDIVWQDEGIGETKSHNGRTQVYFRFNVPEGLPPSDVEKGNRYHLWRIHASCKLPGADFSHGFEVPVFPTAQQSSLRIESSREHESLKEAAQESLENFLQIHHDHGSMELVMPKGRRIGASMVVMLVGLVFLAVGIGIFRAGGPGFLGGVFAFIGVLLSVGGFFSVGSGLRTQLRHDGIYIVKSVYGVVTDKKFLPRQSVVKLTAKETMSSNNGQKKTSYYEIKAIAHDGKKTTIARRLKGEREAEILLESIKILTGYT